MIGSLNSFERSTSLSGLLSGYSSSSKNLSFNDEDHSSNIVSAKPAVLSKNFFLKSDRGLQKSWKDRARDTIEAIRLSELIHREERAATVEEQERLIRFTGFGASELANGIFRRPGAQEFDKKFEDLGEALEQSVSEHDYASLQRCTQYAHFTPEYIVRALWQGILHMGFKGGRVLEPGIGTGLFPALLPEELQELSHFTGIELDPVTARITKLLFPDYDIRNEDFTSTELLQHYDLVVGNPPFSSRIVKSDKKYREYSLRLHDYFIVKALHHLKPGGLAAFVTSTGTLDKQDPSVRQLLSQQCDLVSAFRLPEGSFREGAGTDVVVDLLFFRKKTEGEEVSTTEWIEVSELKLSETTAEPVFINEFYLKHPDHVLGKHSVRTSLYGTERLTVIAHKDQNLEDVLFSSLLSLPENLYSVVSEDFSEKILTKEAAAQAAFIREGSFFLNERKELMQRIHGSDVPIRIRKKSGEGIFEKQADLIKKYIPIRDLVRTILSLQEAGLSCKKEQGQLRVAWMNFVRAFGPINTTQVILVEDEETGDIREQHRRPNLMPLMDDPDCWLVASIEHYDLETNSAQPGSIFTELVISRPSSPTIINAHDALVVSLNNMGSVDLDYMAELLHCDIDEVISELGDSIWCCPVTREWQTSDEYLSGTVRTKLEQAQTAALNDPTLKRNVEALLNVQPEDIPPADISVRLGAPWIDPKDVELFVKQVMETESTITYIDVFAQWKVDARSFRWNGLGTTTWGTERRSADHLLDDALNMSSPKIFDSVIIDGKEKDILNVEATEAAKEKIEKIKSAFQEWIWTDEERSLRLSHIYNDRHNNLVPRIFDGSHLQLPGASPTIRLYDHQKRVIWRIISDGSTYMAHAVGAGKTMSMIAAVMEQKRLGLITKPIIAVPGHCLSQYAREFYALYPNARILVADEQSFSKEKRQYFISRAATDNWDAVLITHTAFGFISVPSWFEKDIIQEEIRKFEEAASNHEQDRTTRKRIERQKEILEERLKNLKNSKDDLLTLSEMGIDQIVIDEAHEFRKLSFSTNMGNLRGIDPNGSKRAFDLYMKSRLIKIKNPKRFLIMASGTPITNTLGEMFTLKRFFCPEEMERQKLNSFDAWAANFGEAATEFELQPSGQYQPVTRFAKFVNIPELISLFRSFADVVMPSDLKDYLRLPLIKGGEREIITSEASPSFKGYQEILAERIEEIKNRQGAPKPGQDILLSVITDGRHAAIDMRLIDPSFENEPENKLNNLISKVFQIYRETSDNVYKSPDGKTYERSGAGQLVFSDLGTIAAEEKRGFSAYRWIKQELVRMGVSTSEVAFMQDYKKSHEKQRLFQDFDRGKIRILIGSSGTMGTGVNVQRRLKALHHLDIPWLPSHIEQREGRILRQGNQNEEIEIYAYATTGSMDAALWQLNERKARFIGAALSGDRSIRTLEEADTTANQFAFAKALASGDTRMIQMAGLESDIARLERLKLIHEREQHYKKMEIRRFDFEIREYRKNKNGIEKDLERRVSTTGEAFSFTIMGQNYQERTLAGQRLSREIVRLATEKHIGKTTLGVLGGFSILFNGYSCDRDKYGFRILLDRANCEEQTDISLGQPPRGMIQVLEHKLVSFDKELENVKGHLLRLQKSLEHFSSTPERTFSYQNDLLNKRAELEELRSILLAESREKEEKKEKTQEEPETEDLAA